MGDEAVQVVDRIIHVVHDIDTTDDIEVVVDMLYLQPPQEVNAKENYHEYLTHLRPLLDFFISGHFRFIGELLLNLPGFPSD